VTNPTRAQDDFREMLYQSREMIAEISWGAEGWLERLDEMAGIYPGAGGGGSSKGTHSDPTGSAHGKKDPGAMDKRAAEKLMQRIYKDVLDLFGEWERNRAPKRLTTNHLTDPGCEPCTSIPATLDNGAPGYPLHFCASHTTADIVERKPGKRGKVVETTQRVRLCSSCYTFWRRNDRLPNVYEVVDHINGKRRVKTPV